MPAIPIPKRMAKLDRDARGYPIPVTVLRDPTGRPHFTINDEEKRQEIIARDRCPICGGALLRGRWFVGGELSAFHRHGAYIDPPMHDECAHYALAACPYLAAPSYAKRIDAATTRGTALEHEIFTDPTLIPTRPPVFVAVMARGNRFTYWPGRRRFVRYVSPVRPYIRVEFWRHGERLDADAAAAFGVPNLEPETPVSHGERSRA